MLSHNIVPSFFLFSLLLNLLIIESCRDLGHRSLDSRDVAQNGWEILGNTDLVSSTIFSVINETC